MVEEHIHNLVDDMKKQMVILITAALGFVAALVWKDAIISWIDFLYKDATGPIELTMAAIIVTIIVVIITVIIAKIFSPKNK